MMLPRTRYLLLAFAVCVIGETWFLVWWLS